MPNCFRCESGHTFIYPAVTHTALDGNALSTTTSGISVTSNFVDTHVCPFCHSLKFSEVDENAAVLDVASVPHSEVTGKLAMGWKIRAIYAKETVVVLCRKNSGVEKLTDCEVRT